MNCRVGTTKRMCVVKSRNTSQSVWSRSKPLNNWRKEKNNSIFSSKEKPVRLPSVSPNWSRTNSQPFPEVKSSESSITSPDSSSSTGDEKQPTKSSPGSGGCDPKTSQTHTIHNLPILMDHYIISTLSEYIFSY